jgi:hypothetical protein
MSGERFEFNRTTFGLPVESYRVDSFITKDERLPVVTEFVLRLLRICGPITVPAFRDYFGFSEAESLAVAESLSRQGLVVLRDEHLELSPYAVERFEESAEDYPRFTKVEPRRDSVTFDLLSFSPLPPRGMGMLHDLCLRLKATDEALSRSVERAKSAYFRRFPEIARLSEDLRHNAINVYSVEDIQSKRRGYVPIPMDFSLDEQGQVQRKAESAFEERAAPELVSAFHEQVSNELPSGAPREMAAFAKFVEVFDIFSFTQYALGKRFELRRFAEDAASRSVPLPKGVLPIFGNLYLEHNLELLASRVKARRTEARYGKVCTSALWLAPDDPLWGRGDSLPQATRVLGGLLKDGTKDDLALFLPTDTGAESSLIPAAGVLEHAQVHAYRPGALGGYSFDARLELFLYPTFFVAALFHVPVPDSPGLLAPVGFISTLPKHVDTAHKLAISVGVGGAYGGRVHSRRQNAEARSPSQTPDLLSACGFLNFSPLRGRGSGADDADTSG